MSLSIREDMVLGALVVVVCWTDWGVETVGTAAE